MARALLLFAMSDKYEVVYSWEVTDFPQFEEGTHYVKSDDNTENYRVDHNAMWDQIVEYRKALPSIYFITVQRNQNSSVYVNVNREIQEENND